jgi:uncharacterized Zn finger protein (UPF0148 family)
MPLCNKCRTILPPHFVFVDEKGQIVCAYCKTGKNVVTLEDDEGNSKRFTKQEAAGKYKEFTENVIKRPEMKKYLVKDDKKLIV